jgi:hypothetical protein
MSTTISVHMLAFADKGDKTKIRPVEIPADHVAGGIGPDDEEYLDMVLEQVFKFGQNDFQPRPMPSVSVGDVAEIGDRLFMVMPMGWHEISKKEYDALRAPTSSYAHLHGFEIANRKG